MKRAALALVVALSLVCGSSYAQADDPEFVLEVGTLASKETPWGKQLKKWRKTIQTESGDRIKVKIHWGGKMGDELSMVRQLKRNELQGFGGSTGAIASEVPEVAIFELCYLFKDLDEADKVIDGALTEPMREILADAGFVFYAMGENGFRNFATKGVVVHGTDELAKLKMRSQEVWTHEEAYTAFGSNPVKMPVSEVASSLSANNIDGFDNTPLFGFASQWYKEIDTWTISDHIYQPAMIIYNKKWYDALPEDLQKVVMMDAEKQKKLGRKLVRKMQPKLIENLKEAGVTVYEMTAAEKKTLRLKCEKEVHPKYVDKVGGRAKELLKLAQDAK